MTQERTQYGDDAKGQVAWATCRRCGVKDRADALEPRENAGEVKELKPGEKYHVHPAETVTPSRCDRLKWGRERDEGKR